MSSKSYQEWVIELDARLQNGDLNDEEVIPTIFRVPTALLEVGRRSYTPKCLSLGLFDIETRECSVVDNYRYDFARIFMSITRKDWKEICSEVVGDSVEDWANLYDGFNLQSIGVDQAKYRAGNGGTPYLGLSMLDYVRKLLTLDVVFVVCFSVGNYHHAHRQLPCPHQFIYLKEIFEKRRHLWGHASQIRLDMIKLENQIPLPLIKKVVGMLYEGTSEQGINPLNKFIIHTLNIIRFDLPGCSDLTDFKATIERMDFTHHKHFLHCLYSAVCYKSGDAHHSGAEQQSPKIHKHSHRLPPVSWLFLRKHHKHTHRLKIQTVTKLKEAGIKVMVGRGNPRICDVKFKSNRIQGTLYLPVLGVYDETEDVLRNLLAYEYIVEKNNDLMSYIMLMHDLIKTKEDVQLMEANGVLKNCIDDQQLVDMWNSLSGAGFVVTMCKQYKLLVDDISRHYNDSTKKFGAEARRFAQDIGKNCLRKPWLWGGVIAGSTLYIATMVATVYQVLSYYPHG